MVACSGVYFRSQSVFLLLRFEKGCFGELFNHFVRGGHLGSWFPESLLVWGLTFCSFDRVRPFSSCYVWVGLLVRHRFEH